MSTVTYSDFLELYKELKKVHPNWRKGQTNFNALYRLAPNLAEIVRGHRHLDPFHNDTNISAFQEFVKENLPAEQTDQIEPKMPERYITLEDLADYLTTFSNAAQSMIDSPPEYLTKHADYDRKGQENFSKGQVSACQNILEYFQRSDKHRIRTT